MLCFTFFQRIYYLDAEIPFPNSKEKLGRFVRIAENVGDALTFWIWTEDTEKLIACSDFCSAEDPDMPNKCVEVLSGDSPTTKQVIGTQDLLILTNKLDTHSQLNMLVLPRELRF